MLGYDVSKGIQDRRRGLGLSWKVGTTRYNTRLPLPAAISVNCSVPDKKNVGKIKFSSVIHHEATDAGRAGSVPIGWLRPNTVTWPRSRTRLPFQKAAPLSIARQPTYARESSEEERDRDGEGEWCPWRERERRREKERDPRHKLDTQPDPLRLTCVCCLRPCRLSASPLHLASPLQRPSSTGSTTRPLLHHRLSRLEHRRTSSPRIYTV